MRVPVIARRVALVAPGASGASVPALGTVVPSRAEGASLSSPSERRQPLSAAPAVPVLAAFRPLRSGETGTPPSPFPLRSRPLLAPSHAALATTSSPQCTSVWSAASMPCNVLAT